MKHKYKDIVHKHNNIHHIHHFSIKWGDYQSSFHKMFISLTLQEVFEYVLNVVKECFVQHWY